MRPIGLIAILLSCSAYAQSDTARNRLRELLGTMPQHSESRVVRGDFETSCERRLGRKPSSGGATFMQYIHNGMYEWTEYGVEGRRCIRMLQPEERFLSADEALIFIRATESEFRVPTSPTTPGSEEINPSLEGDPDAEVEIGKDGDRKASKSIPRPKADQRFRVVDTSFPYNTVTLIQAGTAISASGVQISPYVYWTAAHALYSRNTGGEFWPVRVFPGHRLPYAVSGLRAAAAYVHPDYPTTWRDNAYSRDMGLLKVAAPRFLPRYPTIKVVGRNEGLPIVIGSIWSDVWHTGQLSMYNMPSCLDSWRRLTWTAPGGCGDGPSSSAVTLHPVGYPDYAPGVDNRASRFPYSDYATIWGNPIEYGLFHISGADPMEGFLTTVSSGQSGGPVFGVIHTTYQNPPRTAVTPYLLGVITAAVGNAPTQPYGIAARKFLDNDPFFNAHAAWAPNFRFTTSTSNPLVVPYSGNFTMRVGAPGVQNVEVYVREHDVYSTQPERYLMSATDGQTFSMLGYAGMRYTFRMFPRGDYSQVLATYTMEVSNVGPTFVGGG